MSPLLSPLGDGLALAFIGGIGPWEMAIILGIGVLLFGKRLPEVGRSLGKGIVEFKKGLQGVENEINDAASRPDSNSGGERVAGDAPKFEIPSDRDASYTKSDNP